VDECLTTVSHIEHDVLVKFDVSEQSLAYCGI